MNKQRNLTDVQRCYSWLEIKAIDESKGIIEGIATTPSPDRVGDVVEPKGAKFKLPLPFLWQHDAWQPIGEVTKAQVKGDGIAVTVKLALELADKIGYVKDAWELIKSGLVRGLSIGFRSIEHSWMEETNGVRFREWEWMELSAVTIPANADASITSVKTAYQATLGAASGVNTGRHEGGVTKSTPGASGKPVVIRKETKMKTYKEQIEALEATRAAKHARMSEIQKSATEQSRTKDAAEREEFDTLGQEISQIDAELKDLGELERLNVDSSVVVTDGVTKITPKAAVTPALAGPRVTINAKLEPGIKFARMAMCVARAKYLQKEGRFIAPDEIYRSEKRWMDSAPDVHLAMKTAVNANDSQTAAGASEWAYAQNIASEFIEYLRPMTLLGRITGWRSVPFNVRIGGMDGGTTGYWVGQGLGIPASRPTSTSISLGITKVGGLSVITKELALLSTPSAEAMIRNDLARSLQQKSDLSLIDPTQGGTTNVQPAALTYGVTARQASGTDYAAFKADWKSMTSNFYAANIPLSGSVIIMKEELAEALSLMVTSLGNQQFPGLTPTGGTLMGRQVYVSQAADTSGSPDYDNMLILLQPGEVFLADDGNATVEASDQVSVEMSDAPGNKSTATATGASLISMFQTESIAIKALRHINWTKARSQACQFIRGAAYV